MLSAMIEALVSGPVGVILGALIAFGVQKWTEKRAERDRQLALMQQLVLAVSDLDRARKVYEAAHVGRGARTRVGFQAAVEFWALWAGDGKNWQSATRALAPASRVIDAWSTRAVAEAGAVTISMSKVAAAGMPLGMVPDRAVAEAAQRLMDASLGDESSEAIEVAIRGLRAAFYPNETPPSLTA